MKISCILTRRTLHTIPFRHFGQNRFGFQDFLLFGVFGIVNSQISRSPEIWPGPSVGRAWARRAPRVGREGFLGGPGIWGNCELICFLKDCLYAQAPEELEKVKCCTCGELKDASDIKIVQSECLINGTRKQTRCRLCANLRPRLARLLQPGTNVAQGYEELDAKGRTFVPSIHVAYMHSLC